MSATLAIFLFITAAVVSAVAAVRLSTHADSISRNTKLSGFLAGTLLLAVATSLPELTATISASVIGNADIAVGNGLGSLLFNIFVLFALDIYFRKKRLFLTVSHDHTYTGIIALLLSTVAAAGLYLQSNLTLAGISMTSLAIAVIYILGIWFVSKKKPQAEEEESGQAEEKNDAASSAQHQKENTASSVKGFLLFAVIIFISGSALSITGDIMANTTGISATAVGSILVALATSIPDAVGVFVALRLANANMAIGAILGSNIFNIAVIVIGDLFYQKNSIWTDTEDQTILVAGAGFFLTVLVMVIIKRDHTRNSFTYILPSLIAVTGYIAFLISIIAAG
ncbi:sodium:calcium antiporter [Sinobaca qinghaiensis]|uniref:sodium:calcium antiporter n=1 Tax=Sinobaca qinghaiensis TaxID=342944 RepID=UPI001472C07A|nr:sodium:calcium antiporter [Sinobaca qinghaiensis]